MFESFIKQFDESYEIAHEVSQLSDRSKSESSTLSSVFVENITNVSYSNAILNFEAVM